MQIGSASGPAPAGHKRALQLEDAAMFYRSQDTSIANNQAAERVSQTMPFLVGNE